MSMSNLAPRNFPRSENVPHHRGWAGGRPSFLGQGDKRRQGNKRKKEEDQEQKWKIDLACSYRAVV